MRARPFPQAPRWPTLEQPQDHEEEQMNYELQIAIYIRDTRNGGTLNVSETVNLTVEDFLGLAKVLGQFHDLAQAIKRTK
jgi:hypothetical protein